jgi:hypothetical protein
LAAFAVKHIVEEQGPLVAILKTVLKQRYSLTSKKHEAFAALGCTIYVVEVVVESRQRVYRLGYSYRAYECYEGAGGALWKGRFKFKNAAKADVTPEGVYFERPIEIDDSDFTDWYKGETRGMTEIPHKHVAMLERIIANPANRARPF